jgi:hypothetical protein
MSRSIRRFAAALIVVLAGFGMALPSVPAHHLADSTGGPLPAASVVLHR